MNGSPGVRFHLSARLALGLGLIAAGVLFTLDNVGVVDAHPYLRWWPALLILVGLSRLMNVRTSIQVLSALLWIVIGLWLLLRNLHLIHLDFWDFWPMALVALGFSILSRSVSTGRPSQPRTDSTQTVVALAFLSGLDRKLDTQDFRGGQVTAIMGGGEIDLRQASITRGEVVVDVFAFWGGIDLIVPGDWTVDNHVIALLGGVEDSRKQMAGDPNKRLVVKGMAIMGGIEIRN
jgi:predicted membrane protein